MLLSIMRKQAKSWLIKFLIAIIAVVFIFYFGYSFNARKDLKMAYVNGELISRVEYEKTYRDLVEAFRMQYKEMWNDDLIKIFDLKNRALTNLIDQKLITKEAEKIGLKVTEQEIQQTIMNYPAFQINGQFNLGRYQALLNQTRMKPEDFEARMAQERLDSKMKQFLFTFLGVTDQELLDNYTYINKKIKIGFVQFNADNFKKSDAPDAAAMEKFFKEHQEGYRIPEKIKIAYVTFDRDAFKEQVKIEASDIKNYYEFHIDSFSLPKQVKARQILFKLSPDATEAKESKVKNNAAEILEKLRGGEDFAALAKKYSEGPTRSKGGELGYFSAGQMAKPFEDAAFNLKKGEISDLVRSRFGYHIILVEDIKEAGAKPLEDVRDQIIKTLTANFSKELAHEKGLTFIDQMPYEVDLAEYASEHELVLKSTDYFPKDTPIPGIGGSFKLRQSIFALKQNETSELVELNEKFYIFQAVDKKASHLPEMEEVGEKVKADFSEYLAAEQAKLAAESYLSELKNGKSWKELAKEKHMNLKETDLFTRDDHIPGIGNSPDLKEAAFGLSANKPYPDTVFKNDKGSLVIRWEATKDLDGKKYQEEKEKYQFSFLQTKHKYLFENWLNKLRENANIKIVTRP